VADRAVAEAVQVVECGHTGAGDVHGDVAAGAVHGAVEEDMGDRAAGQRVQQRMAGAGRGDEQSVDPALLHQVVEGLVGLLPVEVLREQGETAQFAGPLVGAAGDGDVRTGVWVLAPAGARAPECGR
jgi:hypothetical protein